MDIVARCCLLIALCAMTSGCHSPAGPTPTGYAGQWSGTTAQARPIGFTISQTGAVTAITVAYDFNGCSGSETFSGLSLSITPQVQCIPGPCPPSVSSYRAFGYTSGSPIDGPSTSVNAVFVASDRAEGTVTFRNYPGCGSAVGVSWSATRR